MKNSYIDSYYNLFCRSRARQGITMPPFEWRFLKHWWGWRSYVWYPLRHPIRARRQLYLGKREEPTQ